MIPLLYPDTDRMKLKAIACFVVVYCLPFLRNWLRGSRGRRVGGGTWKKRIWRYLYNQS